MTGIKKFVVRISGMKIDPALEHNTANNHFFVALHFILWSSPFRVLIYHQLLVQQLEYNASIPINHCYKNSRLAEYNLDSQSQSQPKEPSPSQALKELVLFNSLLKG